jgi:hypothetical protein
MTYLVQFIRFRRGAREVLRTLSVQAADGPHALARVVSRAGTRTWPRNTDALRVMDDCGRTVLDWIVPAPDAQSLLSTLRAVSPERGTGAVQPERHAVPPLPDEVSPGPGGSFHIERVALS